MSETGPDLSAVLTADYRTAMRGVASTVHVITMMVDGVPKGMTATAVSSLSMDPPSLLVCMHEDVSMHGAMAVNDWFCVNVLTTAHLEVAKTFSDSRLRDIRFETGNWSPEAGPAPRLVDAQAALICRRAGQHKFGTHSIFVGEVKAVYLCGEARPLVYLDGRFTAVAA